MEKVEAINTQVYSPYSVFGSISKGVALGAVGGYAAKFMLPLSEAEKDAEYKTYLNELKEQSKRAKGLPIEAVRALEDRTPAQDVFLKIADLELTNDNKGMIARIAENMNKQGTRNITNEQAVAEGKNIAKALKMREIIKNSGLDEEGMRELRNLIAQVNQKATRVTKQFMKAYNSSVKEVKRPTIAFVTMGAVAGFFGGLAHKIINTNS